MDSKLRIRLCSALVVAYDLAGLVGLVRARMNVELAEVVSPPDDAADVADAHRGVVFAFVRWCREKGRLAELARVAAQDRPSNLELQSVRAEFDTRAATFHKWFQDGTAGPHPNGSQVLSPLTATVRPLIEGLIVAAENEWQVSMLSSSEPNVWQGATDKLRRTICQALKQCKQVNGGELPDVFLDRWVKLNCAG